MVTFADLKRRHIQYLARAEGLKSKIGTNRALLVDIRKFISEIAIFLQKNRSTLTSRERAELQLYRERWITLTANYR